MGKVIFSAEAGATRLRGYSAADLEKRPRIDLERCHDKGFQIRDQYVLCEFDDTPSARIVKIQSNVKRGLSKAQWRAAGSPLWEVTQEEESGDKSMTYYEGRLGIHRHFTREIAVDPDAVAMVFTSELGEWRLPLGPLDQVKVEGCEDYDYDADDEEDWS